MRLNYDFIFYIKKRLKALIIGYARISTDTQVLDQQIDALLKYGIEERHIYKEEVSTRSLIRPELNKALDYLMEGDTFVVCKLDRLGRSVEHLIKLMKRFEEKKINFISLTEKIDTSSAVGKIVFHIISSFAEFERDIISERTKDALKALKKRGKSLGRPFILSLEQKELIDTYIIDGRTKCEIKRVLGVKSTTPIYNYLRNKK